MERSLWMTGHGWNHDTYCGCLQRLEKDYIYIFPNLVYNFSQQI